MTERKFNFTDYSEIGELQLDYLLSVTDAEDIKDIPITDINDFLNELEDWYAYQLLWENQNYIENKSPENFWEHFCMVETGIIGTLKGECCNWCGLNEEDVGGHPLEEVYYASSSL